MGQYLREQAVASGEDFCPEVPGGFQSLLIDVNGHDPGFSGQSHFDNGQANRATAENQNVFTRENAGATASVNPNRYRLRESGPQRRDLCWYLMQVSRRNQHSFRIASRAMDTDNLQAG